MSTTNLPVALVTTALWLIMFFRVRSAFSGVFVLKVPEEVKVSSLGAESGSIAVRARQG